MKSFFRTLLAAIVANVLVVVLAIVVIIGSVAGQMKKPVEVKKGSVLVQVIDGEMPESEPGGGLPFPGGDALSHVSVMENLEKARFDKRIKAVALKIGSPAIGLAKMDELRERVRLLRAAGKPVWGYAELLGRGTLYLGAACDSLFLMKYGYATLHGLASERGYFAGTLEKLGVRPNIHRIEGYKSAAEMVQRKDMSPTSRANANWMLDAFYPAYLQTVEEGRRLAPGTVEGQVFAAGVSSPERLRDLKVVDRLVYWDEVEQGLLKVPGVKEAKSKDKNKDKKAVPRPREINGQDYARVTRAEAGIKGKKTIAIVHATGMIEGEESGMNFPFGATMGALTMEEAFRAAAANKDVAAIVYRVDSGGGESLTSWRIQRAALEAGRRKPMVVSMGDVAGSGGYLICYPCGTMLAGKMSVVGSIGSISGKMNMRGLYDKIGMTKDFVTRGPFSTIDSDYFDYTPPEWAAFTADHWKGYQDWVADIARVRGKTPAEIDSIGRGRVWTGEQALELGLIDRIGGFDDAVALARERGGIPAGQEVKFVHYPQKKSPLEALKSGGIAAFTRVLTQELTGRAVREVKEQVDGPWRREQTWAWDPNTYRPW
jgi:protease-4